MAFKLEVTLEGVDDLNPVLQEAQEELQQATEQMEADLEGVQQEMEDTGDSAEGLGGQIKRFLADPIVATSAAIGAAGLAFKGLVDSTRVFSQEIGVTSLNTGIARDQLVSLATDLSNVTLTATDAARSFRALSTLGITTAEELAEITSAADTLSTAVGGDVVEAVEALQTAAFAMDTSLLESARDLDALGAIAVSLGSEGIRRFSLNVSQLKPALQRTGLSVKDFAAFMLAIRRTGGDLNRLLPPLRVEIERMGEEGLDAAEAYEQVAQEIGITADELRDFRDSVDEGTAAIQAQSEEMARSLGPISELKVAIDDLKVKYGDLLQPVSDLGDVLVGVAAALIVLKLSLPTLGRLAAVALAPLAATLGVTVGAAAAVTGLAVALVGLAAALAFNWLGARDLFIAGLKGIKQATVDALVSDAKDIGQDFKDAFTNLPFTRGGLFGPNIDRDAEEAKRRTREFFEEAERLGIRSRPLPLLPDPMGLMASRQGALGLNPPPNLTINFNGPVSADDEAIQILADHIRGAVEGAR